MERVHFERELEALRAQVSEMATIAVQALDDSLSAFVNHRTDRVDAVLGLEAALNALQMSVDDRALRLVALQQPTARDLRLILAAVRANADLERVGDHSVNLAYLALSLAGRSASPVESTLVGMADLARGMLTDAVAAFMTGNAVLARDVLARDDVEDRDFESVFPIVIGQMRGLPASAEVGVRLLLVARNLERIADHATNIAEQAIFLVEAKDVRHGSGE